MNLRVNLLADEERHHGGLLPSKSMVRAAGVLVVGIIALWIVMTTLSVSHRRAQLKSDKIKWRRLEPDYLAAVKTRSDLNAIQTQLNELSVYQRTRVDWPFELRKLGAHTPTNVQLTELRVSQSVSTDAKAPGRTYTVRLLGRISGPTAEPTVRAFFADLGTHSDFTNLIASAVVPPGAFRSDTAAGATEADRVFEIHCLGKPRKFE